MRIVCQQFSWNIMPYLLFLKMQQNLKLSSAANCRWRFKGKVPYNYFCPMFSLFLDDHSYVPLKRRYLPVPENHWEGLLIKNTQIKLSYVSEIRHFNHHRVLKCWEFLLIDLTISLLVVTLVTIWWQPLQTIWTQIRTNRMWVLIWIQTVGQCDSVPKWFFEKLILKKSQQTTSTWKNPQHARVETETWMKFWLITATEIWKKVLFIFCDFFPISLLSMYALAGPRIGA